MSDLRFKLCPKCKRLMPVGNGASLCGECSEERRNSRRRQRDYKAEYAKRKESENPKYRQFYRSKEWQMTSRRYAQKAQYTCEECGGVGTDVHHVMPIQTPEGWERRFDFDNLKLLCVQCHNEEHGRTFSNGWSDHHGGQAPKTHGRPGEQAQSAPLERGEGSPQGGGKPLRVSDYRV